MVINSGKHAPAKWPRSRILIEYDRAQFQREFMGDKIEKLSDEELTGILKYVDPNFKFFREIAAKWAKQYADHQDGPAIACWAKEKAGQYVTFAEELRSPDRTSSVMQFNKPSWRTAANTLGKPDELYRSVESLFTGPYLDMFARERLDSWTSWGDQTDRFNEAAE